MTANIKHSLTAKIFLTTFVLLFSVCALTYGFIAWVMPLTYTADRQQALSLRMEELAQKLEESSLEDCGPLLAAFATENDAQVSILDPSGNCVKGSEPAGLGEVGEWDGLSIQSGDDVEIALSIAGAGDTSVTQAIGRGFFFPGLPGEYALLVVGSTRAANQAAEALVRVWPWLAAAILLVSVLAALFYARFITRPIVDISAISQKLSGLDFSWRCRENRSDEIGTLARNLNQLTDRLSATMAELQTANTALQADIDRERELDQARLDFFSAASHELKTPITILKGQLGGMLDGVGRYADRDRWLARSLDVAGRMERLVRELLTVSRLDREEPLTTARVDLSALVQECVREYDEFFAQKSQHCTLALDIKTWLEGDPSLLKKAVCSLLSNAALYSPEGAAVHIAVSQGEDTAVLSIENEGVYLDPSTIPRLFEAFYRPDPSRNRQTGGSGLGLYLVKTIAQRHGGDCAIRNTERGVEARLTLPISTQTTHNP
ncbi:MAG: HAMP domain-containing histidine kinase [Oscillospiraceae bacterium]|nr:HAMP domain-containing histidine kinase [Oscillospiraceae bacterium]